MLHPLTDPLTLIIWSGEDGLPLNLKSSFRMLLKRLNYSINSNRLTRLRKWTKFTCKKHRILKTYSVDILNCSGFQALGEKASGWSGVLVPSIGPKSGKTRFFHVLAKTKCSVLCMSHFQGRLSVTVLWNTKAADRQTAVRRLTKPRGNLLQTVRHAPGFTADCTDPVQLAGVRVSQIYCSSSFR